MPIFYKLPNPAGITPIYFKKRSEGQMDSLHILRMIPRVLYNISDLYSKNSLPTSQR